MLGFKNYDVQSMKNRWQLLLLLATIHFTNIVDSMIIMPMGDIFIGMFNINTNQYSLLVASYAIAAFISSIMGMFFLDRFPRKKALLTVYTGFIVGTFLCSFSSSYYLLLSCRFFTGLFGGVLGALIVAIITDLYPFKERGQAIGTLFGAFSAASALGVPTALFLATRLSWRWPFIAIAIVGSLLLVTSYLIFPKIKNLQVSRKPLATLKHIFTDKNQINALFTGMILVLAHFLIIPFITPYMVRNVGFSQDQIILIFLFGGLATIVTAPLIGRLTDKFGVMKVFIILMLLSIIPTLGITHIGQVGIGVALIFTTLFFIFGSGRMIPPNTIITAAVGPESRGSFMSMKAAFSQLSIAIASYLSGAIVFFEESGKIVGYNYVAYLAIIFGLISIYLTSKLIVAKGN